ncbi:YciI family protein [Flagellimonas meridianipacifica]|uniref:YCII-related domain-containing protein n=1 Tax=Flagellimonas meridianipacifica TaxID=1080225 RepID=A0A2T0MIJ8_9FLAO|nr:YciI family protein [Allomuricauda pacifica]PRX57389.1 hypothetical protein CLV81_1393 [Allomuricauda pacifica]
MKEFMLFIRSDEDNPLANFSLKEQQKHVEKVSAYIQELVKSGKMKSAQPLESEGSVVSLKNGSLVDGPYNETKEVISGYYHLMADDLQEAIRIAKADPRFEDGNWKIEVRQIMKVEGIN